MKLTIQFSLPDDAPNVGPEIERHLRILAADPRFTKADPKMDHLTHYIRNDNSEVIGHWSFNNNSD